MAGLDVPATTRVLVGEQGRNNVGKKYPFSWEKLSPLLGFYRVSDAHDACELCMELLHFEGAGHTLAIHTQNDALVREFALKKPVSRLVVNTPSTTVVWVRPRTWRLRSLWAAAASVVLRPPIM